jgi:hypothetical protein
VNAEDAARVLQRFGGLVDQAALDRDLELSVFDVDDLREALQLAVRTLEDWGPDEPTLPSHLVDLADPFEAYFNVADEIYQGLTEPRRPLDQTKSGLDPANAGLFGPEHIYMTLADLDKDWVATARRFVDEYERRTTGRSRSAPPWPPYLPWAEEYSNDLRLEEFRTDRNWEGV